MASNLQDLKRYEHRFVEKTPENLFCLICLCVARDPQQINCCGKLLCKGCLEEHKKHSSNCPHCRHPIISFADRKSQLEILSLKTKCDNSPNGCTWARELRSLDEHLASCAYTLLPCPNQCLKSGNKSKVVHLLRKDMEKHVKKECPRRQYKCPHCQEAGEYQERITEHLNECPMIEVPCPKYGCKVHIKRCNLSVHREECPFEKVPCKYSTIGCKEEVKRKDLAEHEGDAKYHLQLAVDTVHQQQITIRDMQAQSSKMPMTFKFTNFNQHKTAYNTVYSPSFYTSPKGYKMCIGVDANGDGDGEGTHVSVFAYLMKGENDDYLPWPFTGRVTFKLLNQLEDKNHHSMSVMFAPDSEYSQRVVNKERSSRGWGFPKYISHSDLGHNTAKNCQYLKNDRLHFKISVNAQSSPTPWLI